MASAARSESLSSYLRQIGGRPQLTREQEYELARRARKGDASAGDTLALQIKLSELIVAMKGADNKVAAIEDAADEELERAHEKVKRKVEKKS